MTRGSLSKLLSILSSDENPDVIRRDALLWVCQNAEAKSAFMIVDGKTYREGRIRTAPYEGLILKFNQSQELKQSVGKICLLKIHFSQRSAGVLGLKEIKSNHFDFQPILTLLSFFERQQHLKELLELSQNTLRNLSNQSALIAQNNALLFEKLTTNMRRLQGMSKGVIRMQEAERAKISRELHDGIGQALTALKMNLDFAATNAGKDLSGSSRRQLEDARNMAEQSLGEVRELSRLLRPRMLDDLGLFPTLQWAARTFFRRTGIKVKVDCSASNLRMDAEVETMLFRITQEALNNIAKHSQAKTARIQFRCSTRYVRLIIRDDGVGFDASEHAKIHSDDFGSGLSGIRDRVTLWGGKFMVESERRAGTTLRIELSGNYLIHRHSRKTQALESNG